jgi:ATP phosphoribosyltransferase regulatory subunit
MKRNNLITPEGTRDLLFEECTARREIENKLMSLFREHDYHEVITPFVEFHDVFDLPERSFNTESMYKLTDFKGRLMVIRPDSTLPIIRLAETRLKDEPRPLKLCYNQTIYRVNPKESGRDDEIAQCGVEIIVENNEIGEKSIEDALNLAADAIKTVGKDYRFEIGSCFFFEALVKDLDISDSEKETVRKYVQEKNVPELLSMDIPDVFAKLPKLFGGKEVFGAAKELFSSQKNTEALVHLEALENVYNILSEKDSDRITVDLGLTNTRGYYTGMLFNGYVEDFGKPILSGGVYYVNNTYAMGFAVNVSAVAKTGRGTMNI